MNEHLTVKGINYNIDQLFFGLNRLKMGGEHDLGEFKPKLYNCMDTDGKSSIDKAFDKGKGPMQDSDRMSLNSESGNENELNKEKTPPLTKNPSDEEDYPNKPQLLDKGKGIDRRMHPNHPSFQNELGERKAPIFDFSNNTNSGSTNPHLPNFPPKTNPGPGFNVPGGIVPIRDEICKHIGYNSHILRQFRTMDLETAIEQRDNMIKQVEVLKKKIEFGYIKLANEGVGDIPRNDFDVWLMRKVVGEREWLQDQIAKSEGRQTLLLSRIEFIINEENKKAR